MNVKILLGSVLMVMVILAVGCTEDKTVGTGDYQCEPQGSVIGYTGCKSFGAATIFDDVPPSRSCIEYEYDTGVLRIKHINAGFNCCPDSIYAGISIENGDIVIEEMEGLEIPCPCQCLFDVEIEIVGLEPAEYYIKIVERCIGEGDEKLEFIVDLSSQTSGLYCVDRNNYPWSAYQFDNSE